MTNWTWSEESVESLKKLWESGLSASQIAAELGNVSRNAVIGKVHRLGLAGRRNAGGPRRPKSITLKRAPAPRVSRPALAFDADNKTKYEREQDLVTLEQDVVPVSGQNCALTELSDLVCHWPIGDPVAADFRFCGGKAIVGYPYCAHHTRMAYQPAQERRRERPRT